MESGSYESSPSESGEGLKSALDYYIEAQSEGLMSEPEIAAAQAIIQERVDAFIQSLRSSSSESGSDEQESEGDNASEGYDPEGYDYR